MPRHARIDIPGLLQHVIVRGIERRPIFLDEQDREEFVDRLANLLEKTGTHCLAWVLLDNHVHLLVQPEQDTLAQFMRRLLTGYAVVFNRRHHRCGHLFQNRYKSIVCDREPYLLELVRYIHLNPLRAGMVGDLTALDRFAWCGHAELVGERPGRLIDLAATLSGFASNLSQGRRLYRKFLADGIGRDEAPDLSVGGKHVSRSLNPELTEDATFDARILGGGRFVEKVLGIRGEDRPPLAFRDLVARVVAYYGVGRQEMRRPTKVPSVVRARAVISYIAVRQLGMKGVEVANALGCTSSAISHAAARGVQLLSETPELEKALRKKNL